MSTKEQDNKMLEVRSLVKKYEMSKFDGALPAHINAEHFARCSLSYILANPYLLECDQTSLFSALIMAAQLGLVPEGVLGQAYLVPFGRKVQFIPGYRGYITLARQSGQIETIDGHAVYEQDYFDCEYGLHSDLKHKPAFGFRGQMVRAYAFATYKGGGFNFVVLDKEEIESVREKSETYKAFKAGRIKSTPWDEYFDAMAVKTCVRRLAKWLPMEIQKAAMIEDAIERGEKVERIDGQLIIMPEEKPEKKPQSTGLAAVIEKQKNGKEENDSELRALLTSLEDGTKWGEGNRFTCFEHYFNAVKEYCRVKKILLKALCKGIERNPIGFNADFLQWYEEKHSEKPKPDPELSPADQIVKLALYYEDQIYDRIVERGGQRGKSTGLEKNVRDLIELDSKGDKKIIAEMAALFTSKPEAFFARLLEFIFAEG